MKKKDQVNTVSSRMVASFEWLDGRQLLVEQVACMRAIVPERRRDVSQIQPK